MRKGQSKIKFLYRGEMMSCRDLIELVNEERNRNMTDDHIRDMTVRLHTLIKRKGFDRAMELIWDVTPTMTREEYIRFIDNKETSDVTIEPYDENLAIKRAMEQRIQSGWTPEETIIKYTRL